MHKRRMLVWLLLLPVLLFGCQSAPSDKTTASPDAVFEVDFQFADSGFSAEPVQGTAGFFAMDTVVSVTLYAETEEQAHGALTACVEEINRLDGLLGPKAAESDVHTLNAEGAATVQPDTATVIRAGLTYGRETNALFNIAINPIMEAWGFMDEAYRVPDPAEIDALLPNTDLTGIAFQEAENGQAHIRLNPDMSIDLGAIAKGYTSQRCIEVLREKEIRSAMISLGGNIQVLADKPDGNPYRIAIQNPADPEQYAGVLAVTDAAVITSGTYQRYFVENGITYHHIIDPRTGYPAESGLASVTIVSADGTMADAYATALFVMGLDAATDFWRAQAGAFEAIFIESDGRVTITEGIAAHYTPDSLAAPVVLTEAS